LRIRLREIEQNTTKFHQDSHKNRQNNEKGRITTGMSPIKGTVQAFGSLLFWKSEKKIAGKVSAIRDKIILIMNE